MTQYPTSPPRPSRMGRSEDLSVSFEFFPPKTEKMEKTLWDSVTRLAPLGPRFVSVTYGAGGSTRERTHATVARLVRETDLKPAAHLTCVGATRDEVNEVIRDYWEAGVRHIVALRGDPPDGVGATYTPFPGGYENAADLVAGIKAIGDFEVSVAAFPEKHPDSPDFATDMDMLRKKKDAGASRAITQFFFDNEHFYRYLDRVEKAGIDIEITPGIIPIHNFRPVAGFATKAGATVPDWLAARFEGLENDPETNRLVGCAVAAEQVLELIDNGIRKFHFYTLNRANLVYAICHLIGLRSKTRDASRKDAAA